MPRSYRDPHGERCRCGKCGKVSVTFGPGKWLLACRCERGGALEMMGAVPDGCMAVVDQGWSLSPRGAVHAAMEEPYLWLMK